MARAHKASVNTKALQNGANGALHVASDMASDFAGQAGRALHARYDQAVDRFQDVSSSALKRGRRAAHNAQGYAAEVVPQTSRFVRNNPMLALGLAVGVGLFLGLSARR